METRDRGTIRISEIKQGDFLKTYDPSARQWIFSKFVTYLHKNEQAVGKYLSIQTSGNKTLVVSPLHFVARVDKKHRTDFESHIEYVFAKNLRVNDYLMADANSELSLERVVHIETVLDAGAYAPLTESGTLLVNSLYASCYANSVWHTLAHVIFYPIIQLSKYVNIDAITQYMDFASISSQNNHGIFWYATIFRKLVYFIPFSSNVVVF